MEFEVSEVPAPRNTTKLFYGHLYYFYTDCRSGAVSSATWTAMDAYAMVTPSRYIKYRIFGLTPTKSALNLQICDESTCNDQACSNMATHYTLDECDSIIGDKWMLYQGVTPVTMYTTPYAIADTLALENPISANQDCFATIGANLLSGWTVTYGDEQVRTR